MVQPHNPMDLHVFHTAVYFDFQLWHSKLCLLELEFFECLALCSLSCCLCVKATINSSGKGHLNSPP